MKKFTVSDIRQLKGLPIEALQTRFGELDNSLAQGYLNKLIIRTKVREFQEKKKYPIVLELEFIQDQIDRMELIMQGLIKENSRLKLEIKYLKLLPNKKLRYRKLFKIWN